MTIDVCSVESKASPVEQDMVEKETRTAHYLNIRQPHQHDMNITKANRNQRTQKKKNNQKTQTTQQLRIQTLTVPTNKTNKHERNSTNATDVTNQTFFNQKYM